MTIESTCLSPGARVVIRDAEWMVRKIEKTSTGGNAINVVGISELVKDKEAIFLDEIDKNIEILDPVIEEMAFDIPWSLMVFQQRNGRIDRYGQEKIPYILYLVNQSTNSKIKGDMRILELLIQKDEEAVKNIGDPSAKS